MKHSPGINYKISSGWQDQSEITFNREFFLPHIFTVIKEIKYLMIRLDHYSFL